MLRGKNGLPETDTNFIIFNQFKNVVCIRFRIIASHPHSVFFMRKNTNKLRCPPMISIKQMNSYLSHSIIAIFPLI